MVPPHERHERLLADLEETLVGDPFHVVWALPPGPETDILMGKLAQQVGRLSLTLRGMGEVTEGALAPITADQLSDFTAPEKAEEFKVRVRRGSSVTNETIGEPTPPATTPVDPAPAGN